MEVSERTINAIADVVCGDRTLSGYRTGVQLVRLFNEHGFNDVHGQDFPSRRSYVEDKLRTINGTPALDGVLREVLHPAEFLDIQANFWGAADHVNARLKFDGYEVIVTAATAPIIRTLHGSLVDFRHLPVSTEADANRFLDEQLSKCDQKLSAGDYDGAVTNARSLAERVLLDLEKQLDPQAADYDGDLVRLFRRVQKLLRLEPGRPDVDNTLKQVLSGMTSIVAGIAGLSNKMGDRHARSYKPARRHAILAVDSVKTLTNFLISTHREREADSQKKHTTSPAEQK